MKTIVLKESNVSIWIFDDTKFVDIKDDHTVVGDPVEFYISDCTTSSCDLIEDVSLPIAWIGHKYLFTNNSWALNPDWVDPDAPVVEE